MRSSRSTRFRAIVQQCLAGKFVLGTHRAPADTRQLVVAARLDRTPRDGWTDNWDTTSSDATDDYFIARTIRESTSLFRLQELVVASCRGAASEGSSDSNLLDAVNDVGPFNTDHIALALERYASLGCNEMSGDADAFLLIGASSRVHLLCADAVERGLIPDQLPNAARALWALAELASASARDGSSLLEAENESVQMYVKAIVEMVSSSFDPDALDAEAMGVEASVIVWSLGVLCIADHPPSLEALMSKCAHVISQCVHARSSNGELMLTTGDYADVLWGFAAVFGRRDRSRHARLPRDDPGPALQEEHPANKPRAAARSAAPASAPAHIEAPRAVRECLMSLSAGILDQFTGGKSQVPGTASPEDVVTLLASLAELRVASATATAAMDSLADFAAKRISKKHMQALTRPQHLSSCLCAVAQAHWMSQRSRTDLASAVCNALCARLASAHARWTPPMSWVAETSGQEAHAPSGELRAGDAADWLVSDLVCVVSVLHSCAEMGHRPPQQLLLALLPPLQAAREALCDQMLPAAASNALRALPGLYDLWQEPLDATVLADSAGQPAPA